MSVPTEKKKAMGPEEKKAEKERLAKMTPEERKAYDEKKKAETDRNRVEKLIREQLYKATQLIVDFSTKESRTPQEEKILENAPTALAKLKEEFANLVTSNKAPWAKLVGGSWEDLVEPAYIDLKGDFQIYLKTYPEKELYEAPELSSNSSASSASSASLAEKPAEEPAKDSARVTWREIKLRGLIQCCCVVGVPFHLLFGFVSDGNMTHIDRLSKLNYALTRNDKPLSEEARQRLTMEKELVGALLRGDGDAEIAYGAFQEAIAEKAKADAEKAKADAEKPKADDKGATYDSDDEGPASEAAMTAEEQKEAKQGYVAMRVGLAKMHDKDKITELFVRFGLSATEFFSFTETQEPSTEEFARRFRVILDRFAKEDQDLQELAICVGNIAGRNNMYAFFLCEMFEETVHMGLKHNPTFRRTFCSLLRIENKTLPELLGAYVDTLRDSTDPNIMEQIIQVTADPALNLLPYFYVLEDIKELMSEDDYEEGYSAAYSCKIWLEWFLFLYEYKSIEQVSASHSSNSSCSSDIILVTDIFQTNKTLYKSNVSWMTAMSWLKKLWYQACKILTNKIKTAGTHYEIFKLPFEPYALSEESLKTVTRLYRTLSVSGEYCHPDKGGKEEMFTKLSEAYTTLTDLSKKLAYDDATFEADDTDYTRISVYSTITDLLDEDDDEESVREKLEENKSDEETSVEEESDEEESDEETSDEETLDE